MVGRGCSVVTSVGLSGSRSDGVLFVESDPVRNDGVDAHRARGVSLFRPRSAKVTGMVFLSCCLLPSGFTFLNPVTRKIDRRYA